MKSGMENKAKGKLDEVAGKIKQSVGEATNNQSMANRGAAHAFRARQRRDVQRCWNWRRWNRKIGVSHCNPQGGLRWLGLPSSVTALRQPACSMRCFAIRGQDAVGVGGSAAGQATQAP